MKLINKFNLLSFVILVVFSTGINAQNIQYIARQTEASFNAKIIDVSLPVGSIGASADALGGSASYSVPLILPDGTNEIKPSVSISYSSGNGHLGAGWALGVSAITRGNKVYYQDNQVKEYEFNMQDALFLDGNRLFLSNGSYKPESENFSLIELVSGTFDNPTSFRVTTKEGIVMEYGNTTDSRFVHTTDNVLAWRLNKVQYPDGNFYTYTYVKDSDNNDLRLSEINYTGNSTTGLLPYNKVKFNYLKREDKSFTYAKGMEVHLNYLLDNITITSEITSTSTLFKRYEFKYALTDNFFSQLTELKEVGADGVALNSTIFKYGDLPPTTTNVELNNLGLNITNLNGTPSADIMSADFNGDGFSDVLAFHYTTNSRTGQKTYTRLTVSTHKGILLEDRPLGADEAPLIKPEDLTKTNPIFASDFNGDGFDDYITFKQDANQQLLGLNLYYFNPYTNRFDAPLAQLFPSDFRYSDNQYNTYQVGDFDGDGSTDILTTTSNSEYYRSFISFPRRSSFFNEITFPDNGLGQYDPFAMLSPNSFIYSLKSQVIDFDGDGKNELALMFNGNLEVYNFESISNQWTSRRIYLNTQSALLGTWWIPNNPAMFVFADFNGDNKTDFMIRNSVTVESRDWKVYYSTGVDFKFITDFNFYDLPPYYYGNGVQRWYSGPAINYNVVTGAINRNWLTRLISPAYNIMNGTLVQNTRRLDFSRLLFSDINGDGRHDITHIYRCDDYYNSTDYDPTANRLICEVYYSKGDGTFDRRLVTNIIDPAPFALLKNRKLQDIPTIQGDFNGDGKTDFWTGGLGSWAFNAFGKERLLSKVKDGMGNVVEWSYQKMNECKEYNTWKRAPDGPTGPVLVKEFDCSFYGRRLPDITAWPLNYVRLPLDLVQSFTSYEPEGKKETTFTYFNGLLHKAGKGFLGFASVETKTQHYAFSSGVWSSNETTPIRKLTTFSPSIIWTMLPSNEYTYRDISTYNSIINQTITTRSFLSKTIRTAEPVISNRSVWFKDIKTQTLDILSKKYAEKNSTYDNYGNITNTTSWVAFATNADHFGAWPDASQTSTALETVSTSTEYGYYAGHSNILNRPITVTNTKTRLGQLFHTTTNTLTYNNLGQVASTVKYSGLPKSVTTAYEYWPLGNVKSVTTTASGLPTIEETTSYDAKGRYAISHTNVLGQTTTISNHMLWGAPERIVGIDGLVTSNTYDDFGRLLSTTSPLNVTTTHQYSWATGATSTASNLIHAHRVSQLGAPVVYEYYDRKGKTIKKEIIENSNVNGAGGITESIVELKNYNEYGLLKSATQPYKSGEPIILTEYQYDTYLRPIQIDQTDRGSSTISYVVSSTNGDLLTTTTDFGGKVTSTTTDLAGKTVRSSDNGGGLLYTYDSQGNSIAVTNESSQKNLVSKTFDIYGKQTEMNDLSAGRTLTEYNAYGQLLRETSPKNQVSTFQYNLLGQITQRAIPEGTTNYTYYGTGTGASINKLNEFTTSWLHASIPAESYVYDTYGRVETKTVFADASVASLTTTYAYGSNGSLQSILYPSGVGIFYNYFDDGRLKSIYDRSSTGTQGAQLIYLHDINNGQGKTTSYSLGNGKTSMATFNKFGMPTTLRTSGIQDLSMEWNVSTGNLMSRSDFVFQRSETFLYDNLDRLTSASVLNGPTLTMSFSPDGNLLSKNITGSMAANKEPGTYTYASGKHAVTNVSNDKVFETLLNQDIQYTSYHQPASITEGIYGLDYTYGDDLQRLKSVVRQNGVVINSRYYLDGFEIDQTAGVTRYIHYVSSPAGLISMIVKENANAPDYYFTYTDHLGSILRVTNGTGIIIADQNFDAWGRKRNPSTLDYVGAPSVPVWLYRGYTGHEHLPQFGLINMNGRLYDPVLGRMLSTDNFIHEDAGINGFNRYAYALNNPLKYTDPDGENPLLIAIGVGALVGVLSNGIQNEINDRPFFENAGSAALMGGISGAISCGIGAIAADNFFLQMMLHGVSSGIMSEVTGGNFASGFFSGALSSGVASSLQGAGAVAQILGGGVSGGFGSVIGGGSFLDGFRQGIITSGLNHVLHQGVAGIMSEGQDPPNGSRSAYERLYDEHCAKGQGVISGVAGAMTKEARYFGDAVKQYPHRNVKIKIYGTSISAGVVGPNTAKWLSMGYKFLGRTAFGVSAGISVINAITGRQSPWRATVDIGMSALGLKFPVGTAVSAGYFMVADPLWDSSFWNGGAGPSYPSGVPGNSRFGHMKSPNGF